MPVELCSLFPGDTIGEENILGIRDPETGNMKHHKRKANASVVADTQVEIDHTQSRLVEEQIIPLEGK